jgi:hypothetical protein
LKVWGNTNPINLKNLKSMKLIFCFMGVVCLFRTGSLNREDAKTLRREGVRVRGCEGMKVREGEGVRV